MEDLLSFIQTVSDDTALDQLWQRESKSDYARFSESETAALGVAVLDILTRIQREDLREALLVILSRLTLSPEGFEPRLLAPFQKSSSGKNRF